MKHCPNINCPFIEQTGFISEYRDEIIVCADCGTELAHGPAPSLLDLPPAPVEPLPLSKAQKNLMWTVASYSEEEAAITDLDSLLDADIEAVINPDQIQDESGTLVDIYHLQVLPINRFVAQTALGIEETEETVDHDYWDELESAGYFGEENEPEENVYGRLLDEPAEERNQFPLLITIVTILLILVLLWTMTRAYQLF